MPLYVYKCVKCSHQFEKIEKLDAPSRQKCPKCKGRADRQLSAPAVQFKGSGWYVTDYGRSGSAAPADKDKGDAKETASQDTKETKDTKPAKEEKPKKQKKEK